MKTCDEMVNSLLKRREQYLLEQKKKRRTAAKITAAGGCCVMATVIGAGIWNSGMLREKGTMISDNSSAISNNSFPVNSEPAKEIPTPQAPDDSSVIWAEVSSYGNVFDENVFDEAEIDWVLLNGKRIFPSLLEAFEKNGDDSVFAIAVHPCCNYNDNNFVYNGKTLAQYQATADEAWEIIERHIQLLKQGDYLKYGEELYLTGTPDGERWAKEYYDRTVSEIGEELISKYIVDGEFLEDELTEVIDNLENERIELVETWGQAYTAYNTYIFETAAEQINAQGVCCETKYNLDSRPYLLVIFATKDEFEALDFDNMHKCSFALAQKNEDDYFLSDFINECVDCG
ncbi:MAG: hypothetical protein K2N06_11270 [Oscillospiraceae bacterium]|nr:hypothetical protein [Oscillospiraceae bacterium]